MERVERYKCFGGFQEVWQHDAQSLGVTMRFAVYLPPQAEHQKCPVVYWLSGLTCTEQNFITKAGAQRAAAELGLILVAPDTSPRGDAVADDDAYDLGQGAGFYLNASQAPWSTHYRMYDYVVDELPQVIESHFAASQQRAISGHSMGGHGALVIGLKNPDRYSSISAFSPIVAPSQVPWGEKAFGAYLGDDKNAWKAWDACELVQQKPKVLPLRIDQGLADGFLQEQLKPELFQDACAAVDYPLQLNLHEGYDHSYYFIASFIDAHLQQHQRAFASA